MIKAKCRPGRLVVVLACLLFLMAWGAGGAPLRAKAPDGSKEPEKMGSSKALSERVRVLLDSLQSNDREEVLRAEQELLKIGWEAVPQIEERLKSSDAGVFYRLLQQIRSLHAPEMQKLEKGLSLGEDQFSIDKQLPIIQKWLNDVSAPKNERFILQRFRDAVTRYQNGEPRRGLTLAKAILIVAPNASFSSKVRRFIRKCQERIFNESTLRADLKTDKIRYAWDESISVTFRIKNVSGKPVTLHFDSPREYRPRKQGSPDHQKPTENNDSEARKDDDSSSGGEDERNRPSNEVVPGQDHESGNFSESDKTSKKTILLEFEHQQIGISGDSTTVTGYREYEIPKTVRLSPDATWDRTVTFDTSSFDHRFVLRRFTLRARVTPTFVDVGQHRMLRWLSFGRAHFELFPRGMRKSRPVTVEKIQRHLKAGNLRDVFFMSFLLSSNQHEPLVKYFLRVLPFLKRDNARTIMFLLRELTGKQFYYNREKWLNWGRETHEVDARPPETIEKSPPNPIYDK